MYFLIIFLCPRYVYLIIHFLISYSRSHGFPYHLSLSPIYTCSTSPSPYFLYFRSNAFFYHSYLPFLSLYKIPGITYFSISLHCKKRLTIFPSPAGMSLTTLSLEGNNLLFSSRECAWLVTSRLGTGKWQTFFYSVVSILRSHAFTYNPSTKHL
jgi:hypothetical protein